jgi:hypothetical protein
MNTATALEFLGFRATVDFDAYGGETETIVWKDAVRPQPPQDVIAQAMKDAATAAVVAEAQAEWRRRKDAGFTWRGHAIQSDPESRENVINVVSAAQTMLLSGQPNTTVIRPGGWKCADNTYTPPMTLADALDLHGTMVAAGGALFDHAQALKAQLAASADPASIDVTAGWPVI